MIRTAALLLGTALGVAPVGAQDSATDGRWMPYLGCWVDAAAPTGPMTCVIPEGQGVAFLTVADGAVTERRVVDASRELPVEQAGCAGVERTEFSSDGHRLFTGTRVRCGDTERRTRGLMAVVGANEWIEVRALTIDGGSAAWVTRYRAAPESRAAAVGVVDPPSERDRRVVEAARRAAASTPSVEDLVEAHARTDTEAVRAWIVEQGEPLRLDADALIRLADAGVSPEVIDVAVAVSFPDRFEVGRTVTEDRDRPGYHRYASASGWQRCGALGLWQPWSGSYCQPFYSRYSPHYRSGYGLYGGFYPYQPTVVVVQPSSTRPRGRVVKGRGYTQGSSSTGAGRRSTVDLPAASVRPDRGHTTSSRTDSKGKAKPKAKPRGGG